MKKTSIISNLLLRLLTVLLLAIFYNNQVLAQLKPNDEINRMIRQLQKANEDSNKVNLYLDVIDYFINTNVDSAVMFERPALTLANKLKWEKGKNKLKQNLGKAYWRLGKFEKAIQYHVEALKYFQSINDSTTMGYLYSSLGQDYADQGKFTKALYYLNQAKNIFKKNGDSEALAIVYLIDAYVYSGQGNYSEALRVNYLALNIFEKIGSNSDVATAQSNIASGYLNLGNYAEALKMLKASAKTLEKENDIFNFASIIISIGNIYSEIGKTKEAISYFELAYRKSKLLKSDYIRASSSTGLGEMYMSLHNYREALKYFKEATASFREISDKLDLTHVLCKAGICYTRLKNYQEARKSLHEALALSKHLDTRIPLADYYLAAELLDSATGDWHNAYVHHLQSQTIRDSLNGLENAKKILQQQFQYNSERREVLAKAAQEKKDLQQRMIRNSIAATLAGSLLFLGIVYRQRNRISKEKARSEELLLNILPFEVAEELKSKGSAEAKYFDEVSVLFTDFKGFTMISEKLTPSELVAEIHTCFKAFDEIITRHNIEKIKTIGDAYMCAGGLPAPNTSHALDVVKAAVEIQAFMKQHRQLRLQQGKEGFEIRMGIHTGPVVAGIVGVKKFAYDIWGDTVNLASRMESSGEPGKINISSSTYELIKNQCICAYRGKIQAKNKGEIDMYFVEGVL